MNRKNELRYIMKEKRNKITDIQKERLDDFIFQRLITDENFIKANNIFIYVSFENEVDTHRIIEYSIRMGKNIFVPKVISKKEGMKVIEIKSFDDLQKGKYGILEPKDGVEDISKIDLAILPGLAFDLEGGRLGFGAGFYDRFLVKLKDKVLFIALAYEFQLVEKVPMEEFDLRTDEIITEKQIYKATYRSYW